MAVLLRSPNLAPIVCSNSPPNRPTPAAQSTSRERQRAVPPASSRCKTPSRYLEILELIGHGGMGSVFKARQPKLDRFVALKILSADPEAKPLFAERFAREGKLLARLNHPNIVAVDDFGQSDGFYHLLIEYVDDVNLRQAMREERFTPKKAIAIVPVRSTACNARRSATYLIGDFAILVLIFHTTLTAEAANGTMPPSVPSTCNTP